MRIETLSARYAVRRLTAEDVEIIYELASKNTLFYRYCTPFVTRESILRDLKALPPRTTMDDKYYIGFFNGKKLAAILDLIFNFPDQETAFIGLFMLAKESQGRGEGSFIVQEVFSFIKQQGYRYIRLAYIKGNPQSKAFWLKNGFEPTGIECVQQGCDYTEAVLSKDLQQ